MKCSKCASCSSCCGCDNSSDINIDKNVPTIGGIPLTMASEGDTGTIVRITGNQEARRYMSNLGFTAGSKVSVIKRVSKDLIVDIKGSRIAMDASVASRLYFVPM
jgi:ferrous iron transport protein A